MLSYIPYNQYLDIPTLILNLIEKGERVHCFPFEGYWQDLGRPDDYERAVEDFATLKPLILGDDPSACEQVQAGAELPAATDSQAMQGPKGEIQ